MSCFSPMQALRLDSTTKSGKSVIRFVSNETGKSLLSHPGYLSGLPCGQCIGCRLERSRQWAIRMMNEADCHASNSFITLTFDDASLLKREVPMSLDKLEFPDFIKRFRRRISDPDDRYFVPSFSDRIPLDMRDTVRYYMCGEYGELFKRPHYHAIIFGYDFPDKQLHKIKDGMRYYTSDFLSEVWPYGFNVITDVTFDSAAYVARYIMKKHLGKDAWKNYFEYFDEQTGELVGHRIPEYTTMSRRSGIGKAWLDKYLQDVYPRDKIFMRGRGFSRPPKYYDTQYEIINPSDYSRIKQDRVDQAILRADDFTPERLHAKKVIKLSQIGGLKRNLE
ncbi:MAG: replication initiator protein [Microviridae sp.]|nr:MAG: replication initiator protein [Microviridae sp.]